MGWFSNICSSVVSTASNAVSATWNKAKEIASDVVCWMADKAEVFIGEVKDTWKKIKPYIVALSPYMKAAAAALSTTLPWFSGVILTIDKALQALLALENSPILKKLEAAINWTIKAAQHFKTIYLNPKEIEEANERKATFTEAAQHMSEEDAQALALASIINDFIKIQSVIKLVLENVPPDNFEHYLRLRATQKLLANIEATLKTAQSITDIASDDLFMLEIAGKFIKKTTTLTDAETIRLDNIILIRFDKNLTPFVFEEMIIAWELNLKADQEEWDSLNKLLAKKTVILRRLETSKKLSGLTHDEEKLLAEIQSSLPKVTESATSLENKNREMQNYVYAAEGFLQFLEKSEEELKAEGREYLAEEGKNAGMLIISCAQGEKKWTNLTDDERSLIIDFANIFEEDCQNRLKKMLEVEIGS